MIEDIGFREKTYAKFIKHPLKLSLFCIVVIAITRLVFSIVVLLILHALGMPTTATHWAVSVLNFDAITRYIFSIPAIILVGIAVRTNGFKFTFSSKGLVKGLFCFVPLIALSVFEFVTNASARELYFTHEVAAAIFFEGARGLYEEVLFRGLLMSAYLVHLSHSWDKSLIKRLMFIVCCGVFFGVVHVPATWYVALFAITVGITFCAAYVYSKSLLACVVVHVISNAVYQSAIVMGLIPVNSAMAALHMSFVNAAVFTVLCVTSVIFSIILVVKSKPFVEVPIDNL